MKPILEFTTQQDAETALNIIHQMAAQWWAEQGYIVENNEVIGKNAATQQDEPTKQRTSKWDEVKVSPDNTYYFTSLTGNPAWANWKTTYTALGGPAFTEKDFPVEWRPIDE